MPRLIDSNDLLPLRVRARDIRNAATRLEQRGTGDKEASLDMIRRELKEVREGLLALERRFGRKE